MEAPDGYRNKEHWKDLDRYVEPGEQYRPANNHPAERVSWYDAVAFCHWLSSHLGSEVRLPYEWEWQQAATGGNARNDYPWGTWVGAHANTVGSGLNRTTAVGMYPGGASAQGVMDLVGSVWEWCLNTHENPAANDPTNSKARVLRGGSWSLGRDLARATYRFGDHPGSRNYRFGFRLVCLSPVSCSLSH